jgi:hypothetical protein
MAAFAMDSRWRNPRATRARKSRIAASRSILSRSDVQSALKAMNAKK